MAKIIDNPELKAEHEALNHLANVIAKKWEAELSEVEYPISYDGLVYQMDIIQDDFDKFWVLVKAHKHRMAEHLEKKHEEDN